MMNAMGSKLKERTRRLAFQVIFFVEPDEGRYHAWSPLLKGLHAEGDTVAEALQHARELAQLYLETLIEDGSPIPLGSASAIAKLEPAPSQATAHVETVTVTAS